MPDCDAFVLSFLNRGSTCYENEGIFASSGEKNGPCPELGGEIKNQAAH